MMPGRLEMAHYHRISTATTTSSMMYTPKAEPVELFTKEFMLGLKALTRRDGMVAIVSLLI